MQSDEQLLDISNSEAVQNMLSGRGWAIIEPALNSKCESIKMKMDASDDPYVVMACIRQIDGVNFIREVVSDIIARGDNAARAV